MESLAKMRVMRQIRVMNFHAKLAQLIADHPLSQNEIGRRVGIDGSQLSRMANGKGEPTRDHLVILARFFGVPIAWLADDALEEIPTPEPGLDPTVLRLLRKMDTEEALNRLAAIPAPRLPAGSVEKEGVRQLPPPPHDGRGTA